MHICQFIESFVCKIFCFQDMAYNFEKTGAKGYEATHYDYGSIMHYPEWAFQIGNKPTIIPHDANVEIGKRDTLSPCDIEKVQIHYGCKSKVNHRPRRPT